LIHARITFAAHDMNAFADLGRITVEQWHAAHDIGPGDPDAYNTLLLDLMADEDTMTDEKVVSVAAVAALLNWPVAEVIQRGRQAVARQLDADNERMRAWRTRSRP